MQHDWIMGKVKHHLKCEVLKYRMGLVVVMQF